MHARLVADGQDPLLPHASEVVFGMAILAEGSSLPDTVAFSRAAFNLLSAAM